MTDLFNIAEIGAAFAAGGIVVGVLQRLALRATIEINKVREWRLNRTTWAEAAVPTDLRRHGHRMRYRTQVRITAAEWWSAIRSWPGKAISAIAARHTSDQAATMPPLDLVGDEPTIDLTALITEPDVDGDPATPDAPQIRPYTVEEIARWYDVPPSLLATRSIGEDGEPDEIDPLADTPDQEEPDWDDQRYDPAGGGSYEAATTSEPDNRAPEPADDIRARRQQLHLDTERMHVDAQRILGTLEFCPAGAAALDSRARATADTITHQGRTYTRTRWAAA